MKNVFCYITFLLFATFALVAKETKTVELYRWVDFSVQAAGSATGLARWKKGFSQMPEVTLSERFSIPHSLPARLK